MLRRSLLYTFLIVILNISAYADEGMWIPMLLKKYNIEQMQAKGFKLTAEDIYSINKASLKDAVMIFGGGCTGELISDRGLLITNYHCGYRSIQQHSSIDHDYLTDGFWAMSGEEELPNPGLTVTFLKRMEDVTDKVLKGITDNMPEKEREEIIKKNIKEVRQEAQKSNEKYQIIVKPFFYGNQYFLFINEIFKDVRLVGAPPSAIGKFGGDTDNWMWPRHTGDFSVFRIYANKDNKPAEYSKDNVPYKPVKHFTISLKEVKEGDFTMVFGYPGSTYEYVPSYHLEMLTQYINPKLIDVRTKKLDIMNRYQEKDPKVRIQYAAKNASISNSWKRWIGENKGLAKLNAVEKKQSFENRFNEWCKEDAQRDAKYGNLLAEYKKVYEAYAPYRLAYYYTSELVFRNGMEIATFAGAFNSLTSSEKDKNRLIEGLQKRTDRFFKDYHLPLDKEMTAMLLKMYRQNVPALFLPDIYSYIEKHFKGDIDKYTEHLFKKSLFTSEERTKELLSDVSKKNLKKLKKDPAIILYNSFKNNYTNKISPEYKKLTLQLNELNRKYMAAQMEFEKDKLFYPDANFTLRVTYGNVKGYEPKDAVYYEYRTTLKGIIEKDNPEIYDYNVPEKLKDLYKNKDYGQYETGGTVPVCFVATNHTTGGNSGSPVLNAEGQLIGINFDRAWEGVMSDLMFNPDQCRNISLDMHYMLFLIDKFAGAGYLLDEMTIVK